MLTCVYVCGCMVVAFALARSNRRMPEDDRWSTASIFVFALLWPLVAVVHVWDLVTGR